MSRQPREWLRHPETFGRRRLAESDWLQARKGNVTEEVSLLAARIQHELVRRATARRSNLGESLTSLQASGMEMSVDRLWKIMRGEAAMTVRHLADLTRVLGEMVEGLGE